MALRPYEEVAPEPLAFPIGGKVYIAPPVGYLTGMRLQDLMSGKISPEEFGTNDQLWQMLLGDVFETMKTDNVPAMAIARAAFAVLTDYKFGRPAAETVWESGLDPKAVAQKVSETLGLLPMPKPQGSTRSRSTASGSRTRKQASTRSTTSRKK
jgi:hypothetical protein